jgi:hypothetical protein
LDEEFPFAAVDKGDNEDADNSDDKGCLVSLSILKRTTIQLDFLENKNCVISNSSQFIVNSFKKWA